MIPDKIKRKNQKLYFFYNLFDFQLDFEGFLKYIPSILRIKDTKEEESR